MGGRLTVAAQDLLLPRVHLREANMRPVLRITVLLVLAVPAVVSACVVPTDGTGNATPMGGPEVADPARLGQEQVDRFFGTLKGADTDTALLDSILAENFQIVRSDGSRATKAQYLANPASVDTYEIADLSATLEGPTLVVSFDVEVNEVIDGRQVVSTAPRLGVFVWDGTDWRLAAWTNFGVVERAGKDG